MINNSEQTKSKILSGVNLIADTVKVTLGTKGRLVMYTNYRDFSDPEGYPVLTKDGVTVAKNVKSSDDVEQQAIKIVRQAAKNTVANSGDGPQPLYAKILTPNGFVRMKDIKVGDTIVGTNKTSQKVLGVFPKGRKTICKVKFSDGRIVECCEDHLWQVTNISGTTRVLTTKNMLEKGLVYKTPHGQERYRFYVPITKVDFEEKTVPVDPYLLGVLISKGVMKGFGIIEIYIDVDRKHIIDKLSNKYQHSVSLTEEGSHYKVEFTNNDLKKDLMSLGLYGADSYNMFIPDSYKYNTEYVRESLLKGLLDAGGRVNKSGFFQYFTVSDMLKNDFIELILSLGISYKYKEDYKNNNSIHKISEVKGYKFGNRIVDIEVTDITTEMQCIKVSNSDHLYITDNYITTHNTTSTIILTQSIINSGYNLLKEGNVSSWEMNKEIDEAVEDITNYVKSNSIHVDSDLNKLRELATISANDEEIGYMIHDILDELSIHCDIEVKKSKRNNTEIETVNGMRLHKGYFDTFMCNDYKTMTFSANNVKILIYDGVIKDYNQISPYVKECSDENGNPLPLLIYAQDVSRIAINRIEGLLKYNPRPLMIVEHDGFGERRLDLMEDLAVITGAVVVDDNSNRNPVMVKASLGNCDEVFVNDKFSSFIGGKGDDDRIEESISEIEHLLDSLDSTETNEIKYLKKRLANLAGGIAVIKVGGSTPFEMEEKYMRIDDAVLAVKSAIKSGISIGGAVTWIRASKYGINKARKYNRNDNPSYFMVFDSLEEILKQLLKNSGEYTSDFIKEVKKNYLANNIKGYDLTTRKFVKLNDYKVYDATSVLLDCINNSTSVAKSLLSVERAIHFPNNTQGLI